MTLDLTGKRAVVTGAGSGIGRAAVQLLAEQGARVLAVGADEPKLRSLNHVGVSGVHTYLADASSEFDTGCYVAKALELFGGVDTFFNNAIGEGVPPLGHHSNATSGELVAHKLRAVFLGLTRMLPVMREEGAVVNMADAREVAGTETISPYVIALTTYAAQQVAERGIRVRALCPGPLVDRPNGDVEVASFVAHFACQETNLHDPDSLALAVASVHCASVTPLSALTEREKDVLVLLSQYLSNREIAEASYVSQDTVKYHLKNIYAKLGAKNRVDALRISHELGYGTARTTADLSRAVGLTS